MTDWITRWQTQQIGWHKTQVNTRLIEFMDCLELHQGDSVFVPLCGKSIDMIYLLEQGFKVIGVELSELAAQAFFSENNLPFSVENHANFVVYSHPNISIWVGDYFAMEAAILTKISAVYDRAALIALPSDLRAKYAQHLYAIIPKGVRILLLTLDYPPSKLLPPPYSVDVVEVAALFASKFEYQQLQCFNDIDNEPKFLRSGAAFINKATYCLHKNGE